MNLFLVCLIFAVGKYKAPLDPLQINPVPSFVNTKLKYFIFRTLGLIPKRYFKYI